jgi:hypothetical protein
MLTSSVVLFHDNAVLTLMHCWIISTWELFDHPPYGSDLTLSDYHLFKDLKNWLKSQCFNSNELMEGVKIWLSSQMEDFFDTGMQNLIP